MTRYVLFILFIPVYLFSQNIKEDSTITSSYFKIDSSYYLSQYSRNLNNSFFLWNDRKNTADILELTPGFFLKRFNIGGRTLLSYNNYDEYQIGIFRDGIQFNDILFGGFENESISVNEIESVELVSNISSYLYAINSNGKSINIVTKDEYKKYIFSQLRYSQDRYGALYADFYITMPFSRKLNFTFGLNNHAYDGRYDNTDLSIWRGRFKLNYYPSDKFNIKLSFYPSKIQRGLNEGLSLSSDDTLRDPILAKSLNLDSYEKLTFYHSALTLTGSLLGDKTSITSLNFYTNNTFRAYRDEENRSSPNGKLIINDFHYIQYGLNIRQSIKRKITDYFSFDILAGYNGFFNLYNFSRIFPQDTTNNNGIDQTTFDYKLHSLLGKIDFFINKSQLSASSKLTFVENKFISEFGVELKTPLINSNSFKWNINGGANYTIDGINYYNILYRDFSGAPDIIRTNQTRYIEVGTELQYGDLSLKALHFGRGNFDFLNANYSLDWKSQYVDGYINLTHLNDVTYLPEWTISSDIYYHNYFFNDKLNLRIGLITRFESNFTPLSYSQYRYASFYNGSQATNKHNFTMDIYLGARIGTANINLTVANIFDNLNYSSAIYPWDNRGGFLQSLSRFTIVWDFNR